jgi:DNA-nicking Smr family endonuclease
MEFYGIIIYSVKSMREVYIRKMRFEEARRKLERELDKAFLEGETLVEVVHGVGEEVLKKMTIEFVSSRDYLRIFQVPSFIHQNPGSTKVEILSPSKKDLKKYMA